MERFAILWDFTCSDSYSSHIYFNSMGVVDSSEAQKKNYSNLAAFSFYSVHVETLGVGDLVPGN